MEGEVDLESTPGSDVKKETEGKEERKRPSRPNSLPPIHQSEMGGMTIRIAG